VVHELPLHGRRVDIAVLTGSGRTAAFELKIGRFGRVLEQAVYNRASFNWSYVVVDTMPRDENLELASAYGVGVIVIVGDSARIALESPLCPVPVDVRRRIRRRLGSTRGA
jgi:voltage-gated potassium channel Kch